MRYPTNEINHSSSNVPIKRGHESADSKSENSLKQEFEWLFDKFLYIFPIYRGSGLFWGYVAHCSPPPLSDILKKSSRIFQELTQSYKKQPVIMTLWENLPQYVALVLLVAVSLFIS